MGYGGAGRGGAGRDKSQACALCCGLHPPSTSPPPPRTPWGLMHPRAPHLSTSPPLPTRPFPRAAHQHILMPGVVLNSSRSARLKSPGGGRNPVMGGRWGALKPAVSPPCGAQAPGLLGDAARTRRRQWPIMGREPWSHLGQRRRGRSRPPSGGWRCTAPAWWSRRMSPWLRGRRGAGVCGGGGAGRGRVPWARSLALKGRWGAPLHACMPVCLREEASRAAVAGRALLRASRRAPLPSRQAAGGCAASRCGRRAGCTSTKTTRTAIPTCCANHGSATRSGPEQQIATRNCLRQRPEREHVCTGVDYLCAKYRAVSPVSIPCASLR